MKFSKDGTFIKTWGKKGAGPGDLDGAHGLAFDSRGRLFVADRTNSRIQIFDQDGKFLAEWKQFSRPSGLFIDKSDVLYVTDSESTDTPGYGYHPGWKRGIRVGSAKDGTVSAFIPDSNPVGLTSGAEGIAADMAGNIYAAEVGARRLMKYVRESSACGHAEPRPSEAKARHRRLPAPGVGPRRRGRGSACGHAEPRPSEAEARHQRQFAPGAGPRRQRKK